MACNITRCTNALVGLKGGSEIVQFKLISKKNLTRNTYLFRFELPSLNHCLGLQIGQHVTIHHMVDDEDCKRSYTPISLENELGHFDLAIRVYEPDPTSHFPDGGVVSQYLNSLSLGSLVRFSGPRGGISYLGHGAFSIKKKGEIRVKNMTMIAGGTGITPMYRIINYISSLTDDKTNISLIYANRSVNDIMLGEELSALQKRIGQPQFKIYNVLADPPEKWSQGVGQINTEILKSHAFPPDSDSIVLCCGRKAINDTMSDLLVEIGYKQEQIHCF